MPHLKHYVASPMPRICPSIFFPSRRYNTFRLPTPNSERNIMSSTGHSQSDGGRPNSNITERKEDRIAHPSKAHYAQYAEYQGRFTPKNHSTMESISQMGPSPLHEAFGGSGSAPKVNGGWHDSSARNDGRAGAPDHLNIGHGGEQWHVERDGSHSVYNKEEGKMDRYPGEDEHAKSQTHVERQSEGGGTFWTRRGN